MLVPFNVRIKQEKRGDSIEADKVSYIRYVEINVYGKQFRLIKKEIDSFKFLLDGVKLAPPYLDNDQITIVDKPRQIIFSTSFGLQITWDGDHAVDVTLCDAYRTYVCGLCGNADSMKFNI